jgi:hypothetical protein
LSPVGYDDAPTYAWNQEFQMPDFVLAMEQVNRNEVAQMQHNLQALGLIRHPRVLWINEGILVHCTILTELR